MDVAQVKRSPTFYQAVHGAEQSFFFSLDQVIHIFSLPFYDDAAVYGIASRSKGDLTGSV